MKLLISCFGEAVLWSAAFVFYLAALVNLFNLCSVPPVWQVIFSMLAGAMVTFTYHMWLHSLHCYRKMINDRRKG